MPIVLDVHAPDGWICEVVELMLGTFSPRAWKANGAVSEEKAAPPSEGLRRYPFPSAEDAMLTAFRERLQRDTLLREIVRQQRG